MLCPNPRCEAHPRKPETRVKSAKIVDSRTVGGMKYRRRECLRCQHRWTTYEIEAVKLEKMQTALKFANMIKTL